MEYLSHFSDYPAVTSRPFRPPPAGAVAALGQKSSTSYSSRVRGIDMGS